MGIRTLRISRWTGGNWGPLDKEAARPCLSMFLFFDSLCLSFFPSVSALCFVLFFFAPSRATTNYSSYVSPDCSVVAAVESSFLCSLEDSGRNNSVVTFSFLSSDLNSSENSSGPHLARPLSCTEDPQGSAAFIKRSSHAHLPLPRSCSPFFVLYLSDLVRAGCKISGARYFYLSLCVICCMSMQLDTDFLLLQQCELEVSLVWKMLVFCASSSQQPICPANRRGSYQCK